MTEPFVQNADNTNEHASNDNAPFVDNANSQGAGDDNVDTKSVEYQLKVVQQRIEDKDNFIETLKGETKELRDTISLMEQRMASVEEIKKALKNNSQNVDNQNTNIDEDAFVGKVIEAIDKRDTTKVYEDNYNKVMESLTTAYGSQNVYNKVKEVADSNGLSVDYMADTARRSPAAFYKLMGINEQPAVNSPKPTQGTVVAPNTNETKDLEYYSKLRRENPAEFSKPETQKAYRLAILNNIEQ